MKKRLSPITKPRRTTIETPSIRRAAEKRRLFRQQPRFPVSAKIILMIILQIGILYSALIYYY